MDTARTDRASDRRAEARPHTATINLRIEPQTRDLIDAAAGIVGKSRTQFMIDSARRDAIDVLLDQRLFMLDPAKFDAFVAVLDTAPPAGSKLKALLKKGPLWDK